MKKEKFNSNDWQGRSKYQIESNYKTLGYGVVFILGIGVVSIIISFINGLLE